MGLRLGACGIPEWAHWGEDRKRREEQVGGERREAGVLKRDQIKTNLNFTFFVQHQGIVTLSHPPWSRRTHEIGKLQLI